MSNRNVQRGATATTQQQSSAYKKWKQYIRILIGRGEFTIRKEKHLQQLVDQRFGPNCCVYHLSSTHKSEQCQLVNQFLLQASNSTINNENKPSPAQPTLPTVQQVNDGIAYAQ